MWYIVYRTPFKSYHCDHRIPHFVRYKNKLSDEYSANWFESSKYITIGGSVNRLGVYGYHKVTTLEDFIRVNDTLGMDLIRILPLKTPHKSKYFFYYKSYIRKQKIKQIYNVLHLL